MDPSHITQVGLGFWPSTTVLSAVDLGIFTALGERAVTANEIHSLPMHPCPTHDWFDGLVELGFVERTGEGDSAQYRTTPATRTFLDYLARLA
jgi:hypothetical protein